MDKGWVRDGQRTGKGPSRTGRDGELDKNDFLYIGTQKYNTAMMLEHTIEII